MPAEYRWLDRPYTGKACGACLCKWRMGGRMGRYAGERGRRATTFEMQAWALCGTARVGRAA